MINLICLGALVLGLLLGLLGIGLCVAAGNADEQAGRK